MEQNKDAIKIGMSSAKKTIWLGICLFIAGMFMSMFGTGLHFLFIIAAIIIIVYGYKQMDKAKQEYAEVYLMPLIKEVFPDATFVIRSDSEAPALKYTGYRIFEDDHDRTISAYLKANDESDFEMFTLQTSHESSDSDGNDTTVVSFHGTVLGYKCDTGLNDIVRILCSNNKKILFVKHEFTYASKKCNLTPVKIETGNIEFDENYEVFAGQMHDAYYLLNPYVMEKLQALREKYGRYCMAITEDSIKISFQKPDLIIELPSLTNDIDENPFANAKKQIEDLKTSLNDIAFALSKHTEQEKKY